MARPLKKGLDYFPHDCGALHDPKIEAMRALFQNDGYAFYFIMLEAIYASPGCALHLDDTTVITMVRRVGVSKKKFGKMLDFALEIGLFEKNRFEAEKVLTSGSIRERSCLVLKKREEMRRVRGRVSEAQNIHKTATKVKTNATSKSKSKEKEKEKEKEPPTHPTLPPDGLVAGADNLSVYEDNIGIPDDATRIEVRSAAERYPEEWFRAAVREACVYNRRNWQYVRAILERWGRESGGAKARDSPGG